MNPLLEEYPVVIEIPVAWGEMDAFNHVNNTVYFRYFEAARIAYFVEIHIIDFMKQTGIGPILASISCTFKVPLTYPDTIVVGAKVTDIKEDRFTMKHAVFSRQHQKMAAEGEGVIVTYDYRGNKKVAIPEELKKRILTMERQ